MLPSSGTSKCEFWISLTTYDCRPLGVATDDSDCAELVMSPDDDGGEDPLLPVPIDRTLLPPGTGNSCMLSVAVVLIGT